MYNFWPYLLRLAVSLYFIYPHGIAFLSGTKKLEMGIEGCINEYIPDTVLFTVWHALFIILGLFILFYPRPAIPLTIALAIISTELFFHFKNESYTGSSMLLFVLILVTLALIIFHSRADKLR